MGEPEQPAEGLVGAPDPQDWEVARPEPPAPDTRGRGLARLGFCALVAGLLLWLPVTRLAWSLEVVDGGTFGQGVVIEDDEQALSRSDSSDGERVVEHSPMVIVEYADPPRRTVFVNREELLPGDRVDLA